jgi:ribose transport system permease protein
MTTSNRSLPADEPATEAKLSNITVEPSQIGGEGVQSENVSSRPRIVTRRSWRESSFAFLRSAGVLPALILVFVLSAVFVPNFTGSDNLLDTVEAASVIGLLTVGQAFVVIAGGGGIDVSDGAILALSSVVGAHFVSQGPIVIILATIATGLFMGLVNGIGVAIAGMQPFVMTLATLTIAMGAATNITNATPTTLTGAAAMPWLTDSVWGIPVPVIVFAAFALIGQMVIGRTTLGRQLYFMGGNEEAARLVGIPITTRKLLVYVISGLSAAIAALLLMARLGTADPNFGNGYELSAIAAVVVGGAPLTGGQGSIIGAAAGVLIIQIITDSLGLLNVNPYIQEMVTGLIVIVVVGLNRRGRENGVRDLVKAIPLGIILLVGAIIMFKLSSQQ